MMGRKADKHLPPKAALPHQNRPLSIPAILLSLSYKDAATRIQGCW
jgi:hypothetical protein